MLQECITDEPINKRAPNSIFFHDNFTLYFRAMYMYRYFQKTCAFKIFHYGTNAGLSLNRLGNFEFFISQSNSGGNCGENAESPSHSL
jgi:hypothetical protein